MDKWMHAGQFNRFFIMFGLNVFVTLSNVFWLLFGKWKIHWSNFCDTFLNVCLDNANKFSRRIEGWATPCPPPLWWKQPITAWKWRSARLQSPPHRKEIKVPSLVLSLWHVQRDTNRNTSVLSLSEAMEKTLTDTVLSQSPEKEGTLTDLVLSLLPARVRQ